MLEPGWRGSTARLFWPPVSLSVEFQFAPPSIASISPVLAAITTTAESLTLYCVSSGPYVPRNGWTLAGQVAIDGLFHRGFEVRINCRIDIEAAVHQRRAELGR